MRARAVGAVGAVVVLLGSAGAARAQLRMYSDEVVPPPLTAVLYGFDREELCTVGFNACTSNQDCNAANPDDVCGVALDALTPGTQLDIWDLVCDPDGGGVCQADSWDFSGNNLTAFPGMRESASTTTAIDSTETCSWSQCGFSRPGAFLGREDLGFGTALLRPTLNAYEFEDEAPTRQTFWLRGAVRNEGVSGGGLGESESRICYVDSSRTEVPLYRFPHCDGAGCYFEVGDSWEPEHPVSGMPQAFQCENNVFNHVCPSSCGALCTLFAYVCTGYGGKQTGEVLNEGTVTLPSGHTFRTLVMRTNAEFCLALFSSCSNSIQQVRTVVYLWLVPNLGTVVRLQSRTKAESVTDFNTGNGDEDVLSEMDIKFGLLPPLSVTVGSVTDTTVELSWDPGLVTHRIDGYRIYWDTDSGAVSPYAFDSVADAGQVSFAGPSATISGLAPGTTYFFTVTSVSDFTDPSSGATTTYESLLFPRQAPAVPVDLPVEVSALTATASPDAGAVPDGGSRPGTPLRLTKGAGTIDLTWGASCVGTDTVYGVYRGDLGVPTSAVQEACDVAGLSTSVAPPAGDSFFLVVPANAGVEGSYGLDSGAGERDPAAVPCRPQSFGAPVCP